MLSLLCSLPHSLPPLRYHDGQPPELSCCSRRFRTSPSGKGAASRKTSTAPLSKTGLLGSVRLCVSLSPSEPNSLAVTWATGKSVRVCVPVKICTNVLRKQSALVCCCCCCCIGDIYIRRRPCVLAVAGLDADEIVVHCTGVIVLQQSHLPLMGRQETFFFFLLINLNPNLILTTCLQTQTISFYVDSSKNISSNIKLLFK